jgi:hypothetical protein
MCRTECTRINTDYCSHVSSRKVFGGLNVVGCTVHMHSALLEKEYDPDLGRISVLAEISRPRECTSVHPSPSPVCGMHQRNAFSLFAFLNLGLHIFSL